MQSISIKHPDANIDWGHGITIQDLEKITKNLLEGREKMYWQYCNIYKVNPALLLSISMKETSGNSNALKNYNNHGGMTGKGNAGSQNGLAKFTCVEEGIRAHVSSIARIYVGKGLKTIEQIQKKYNPTNSGDWVNGVTSFYKKTGKTYSASVAGTGVSSEILKPVDKEVPGKTEADHLASIKKQLLPSKLEGKAYWKQSKNPEWIVIHNTGGGTAKSNHNYFATGSEGRNVSAHYCVDDKEIYQCLEDTWKGVHTKGNAGPAASRGCSNSNSIGIEMADGSSVDMNKALEIVIELTRYLAKKHSIPMNNIVQHAHTQDKKCPAWIINNNKWDYLLKEVKRRNDEQLPINFDDSLIGEGGGQVGNGSGIMPGFDNREDWTNLTKVEGVILNFIPPYHLFSAERHKDEFLKLDYDREFHYTVDSASFNPEKDTSLIAFSMQDNNTHTYIERALFNNKAPKSTLSIGIFCSKALEDYTVTETNAIENIAKVLYDNKLTTNDLWREFDLNRAPSPIMYLERTQWKKFLIEIDKQVSWHYENYGGEPGENLPGIDAVGQILNINQDNVPIRKEAMSTSTIVKRLNSGTGVKLLEYKNGYFRIQDPVVGWVSNSHVGDKAEPEAPTRDKGIPKPDIKPTMTHEDYLRYISYADPKIIDIYTSKQEPYDKALPEIINSKIVNDDRLNVLTQQFATFNETNVHYSVVEGSPGATDHCAKPAGELNVLYKSEHLKVDPIYPDLVIPPNYHTSDNNIKDNNILPLIAMEESNILDDESVFNKSTSYDYDLLKDKKKESKGSPINYLDPYPWDDKITELQKHYPKVKIDEIESRLHETNHPGDPSSQPIAKNFALLYDMAINQAKRTEKRLVLLENTLSIAMRNISRMGARININCVYYGGQDVFGKHKSIRCLKDDMINDCSMTIDQCLSCTRYEPIIGQIYEILDETGQNGSTILDQMQASYMDHEDITNLNKIEKRASKPKYAKVDEPNTKTPKSSMEEWKDRDKEKYIAKLKEEITDPKELEEKIQAIKEEDYAFIMNWSETYLEMQEPDVKLYPNEGIKAKYKAEEGDKGEDPIIPDDSSNKKPETSDESKDEEVVQDEEYEKDLSNYDKLVNGEWVDTREEADALQINKYSSEDIYFEGYNIDNTMFGGVEGSPSGGFNSHVREKIVEMALKIVKECDDGLAWYEMKAPRTTKHPDDGGKYVKRNCMNNSTKTMLKNMIIYDCSSFTSCCYYHANLTGTIVEKTADAQYRATLKSGGMVWKATDEGALEKLKPGDLIWNCGDKSTISNIENAPRMTHVMVYTGDGKVSHASNSSKGIRTNDMKYMLKSNRHVFGRPKELMDADLAAESMQSSGGQDFLEEITTKTGQKLKTVYKFPQAVVTGYDDIGSYATSYECKIQANSANRAAMKYCAAHNMPYGTKIYIPDFEGSMGESKSGIFTVLDTGGPLFDFDIHVPPSQVSVIGKNNKDVYVLEWGQMKHPISSFTKMMNGYSASKWKGYVAAKNLYKQKNGVTVNFFKFVEEDKNIKNEPRWND